MRISWNWLRTLVDIDVDVSAEHAAELLTGTGLEVEHIDPVEPVPGMLNGVVVGRVASCEKHPDADRLSICMVDIGAGDPEQIICGAPNVVEGQKVLVATVGTTLHMADGTALTIKKAKIRGVESRGMICAEDELGLGNGHDGILVLDQAAQVGMAASEHLGLHSDKVLEIGLTPNRADAMGHLGVARDLAAALDYREGARARVHLPDLSSFHPGEPGGAVRVTVEADHACSRYTGVTLQNARVGPSPAWIQDRLRSIGLRPINAVVDVTNFVMHELGQPLHAFDADRIQDGRIIVRHLPKGTSFITLDGKEHKLSDEDLMITDAKGGLCIAGVHGGLGSGVTEGTSRIFLESAHFDPISIRRTARRHGSSTDASFRFERGVDPEITPIALKRAALLLQQIAGAEVVGEVVDIHPHPAKHQEVALHLDRLRRSIGMEFKAADVRRILELLGYGILEGDTQRLLVSVPPYRVDVHREVDLIEEVLRIHGHDRVPVPDRLFIPSNPRAAIDPYALRRTVAGHFAARGLQEVMTSSLVNGGQLALLGIGPDELVRLKNPLSGEMDVMRPSLLSGLLSAAAYNAARQRPDLALFEQGRTYAAAPPAGGPMRERDRTAILFTGRRQREGWRSDDGPADLDTVREEIEALLERTLIGIPFHWSSTEHVLLENAVRVSGPHGDLCVAGRVPTRVAKAFDLHAPCFHAELDEAVLLAHINARRVEYQEVPRYPAVRRDLSLLLDRDVPYAELEHIALHAERKLLKEVLLFDVYEGERLPPGKKSYALGFVLQDPTRTLTDEQVDKVMGRIRARLEKEAGAELR